MESTIKDRDCQMPWNILFHWLPQEEWLTKDFSSIRELSNILYVTHPFHPTALYEAKVETEQYHTKNSFAYKLIFHRTEITLALT